MMPIRPPALDDRSFDDLVAEMLRRIPAHTPEWTNPVVGDPGRTLIDLFAWLADTILYRANLIPERQRLAFLRLLGIAMRPAQPAHGLLGLSLTDQEQPGVIDLPKRTRIAKPVAFETEQEISVMPLTGQCFIKRRMRLGGETYPPGFLEELAKAYKLNGAAAGYITTSVFSGDRAEESGRDIIVESFDGYLWMALLAPRPSADGHKNLRNLLTAGPENQRRIINVGLAPAIPAPSPFDDAGVRRRMAQAWHVEGPSDGQELRYAPLEIISDGTLGLTRAGVVRLLMPGSDDVGRSANDIMTDVNAGVGNRPPRIDDPSLDARIVTWLRFTPAPGQRLSGFRLAWAGINAVSIEQRETLPARFLGQGTGASGQEISLGVGSVEMDSLEITVDDEAGPIRWRQVPDVAAAGLDDPVYSLDREAGLIRFGDGVRGRAPAAGQLIEAVRLRAGGGAAGNLPAGSIRELDKSAPGGSLVKAMQPLPTAGGADAESLDVCERRIPQVLRHQNRAVTESDFQELAIRTPGVAIGRVEVLPRFKPQQQRFDVPGVVSVMVLPARDDQEGPAPRADRPMLEAVHSWLDGRRPLATEMYVIGCQYVPMAVSVGIDIVDPDQRDGVMRAVRQAIRNWLWALPPGGPMGKGWPLGRTVQDREIELAAARVPGVAGVGDVRLFTRAEGERTWQELGRERDRILLRLKPWQLPELLGVMIGDGAAASELDGMDGAQSDPSDLPVLAVPVVPELC
jgi:Baseplate J-like protein